MNHITRRTAGLLAALLLTVPLALSACSRADDPTPTAGGAGSRAAAEWGACMRDAGFDVSDPDADQLAEGVFRKPAGVDGDAFDRAAGKCLESAGIEGSSTAQKQRWEREYAEVASCIRERGFDDLPEQQAGNLDVSDYPRAREPEFERAFQDCLREYAPDTQYQSAG